MSIGRTSVAAAAVAGLLLVALPGTAHAGHPIEGGDSISDPAELSAGTMQDPRVYTLHIEDGDPIFFDVDIPEGQRIHVGFLIDPATAAGDANIAGDLLDAEGNISSYVELDTVNDDTSRGLRSGYLRSETMDPANRSWGRDTVLRIRPSGADYPVQMSVSVIPDPVDGGALTDVDRPPLRYAEELVPVAAGESRPVTPGGSFSDAGELREGSTAQSIPAGATRFFRVPVGWLQAVDLSAAITEPGDGVLSWKMFNTAHEPMTLVGEWEFPADRTDPVTFGQRTPLHHKNVSAKNKTRNTGFLGDYVYVAVTNTSSSEVGYVLSLAQRGEAVEPGPVFDARAAAEQARTVEAVDYQQYRAPEYEEPVWRRWLFDPLAWVAGALILAAIAVGVAAVRRR